MDDLDRFIAKWKRQNPGRAEAFDDGYMWFKLSAQLKSAREQAGLTQTNLAIKLGTARSTISRIENHADNITLSTLRKYAKVLGKKVHFEIV